MTALSIITICRNDREGLKRTVESVMGQSSPPTELIIVDGSSTDGTQAWLASTAWPPFVSWASESDDGIYDAMNKGITRVRERGLVMFLNAGDWLTGPETLASIRASYDSHGWRWAAGGAMTVDASGRPLREMIPRSPVWPLFLIGLAPVPHPASVFSYALLHDIGTYDPSAGIAADQQYMLRCWLSAPPFALRTLIANFDSSGVSSAARPWFCAVQMRRYRLQLGRPVLGSPWVDLAATALAITTVGIAAATQPQARIRRLIARFRDGSRTLSS